VIDFGDPTKKACGPHDPRIYLRSFVVEEAARDLLGMVPQADVDELRKELESANAEAGRLRAIVSAGQDLVAAEERLRESLGPAPDPEGTR